MDKKHTPGPWNPSPVAINSIDIFSEEDDFVTSIVANNEEDLLTEREWANARLISAAPDLFDAVNILLNTPIDQFDSKKIEICIRARDKALGKEEGWFKCKGCSCELWNSYSMRTKGYCYLCDPNIALEELLSDEPLKDSQPEESAEQVIDKTTFTQYIQCDNGKVFSMAEIRKQGGLKRKIVDLCLSAAAPDDDCMLRDFLMALQHILDSHAPIKETAEQAEVCRTCKQPKPVLRDPITKGYMICEDCFNEFIEWQKKQEEKP